MKMADSDSVSKKNGKQLTKSPYASSFGKCECRMCGDGDGCKMSSCSPGASFEASYQWLQCCLNTFVLDILTYPGFDTAATQLLDAAGRDWILDTSFVGCWCLMLRTEQACRKLIGSPVEPSWHCFSSIIYEYNRIYCYTVYYDT